MVKKQVKTPTPSEQKAKAEQLLKDNAEHLQKLKKIIITRTFVFQRMIRAHCHVTPVRRPSRGTSKLMSGLKGSKQAGVEEAQSN